MYNLLITHEDGVWENNNYEMETSRFLEYTLSDVSKNIKMLNSNDIEYLKSIPCLFAYEGEVHPYRVGWLTKIKKRDSKIYLEFKIDENIPPISYTRIKGVSKALDIRDWEINRTHWAVKDEDLFEILASLGMDYIKKTNEFDKRIINVKEKTESASTVRGFIGKVFDINNDNKYETFYRGHANKNNYRLEPSLFRKDDSGNYLFLQNEDILYRELLVSDSKDFEQDKYTLDKLVRMQHYSLPTRMLDITSNPLIALFFACISEDEIDGEVIIFEINKELIKYFDSDTASCISNLARLPQKDKNEIDFSHTMVDFNKQKPVQKLLHLIREEKPYFTAKIEPNDLKKIICVKSKMTNSRIVSQSGAFLLFGHESIMDEAGIDGIKITRITVRKKGGILKELDKLNINERTVFPYIENSAKYIREKFKMKH